MSGEGEGEVDVQFSAVVAQRNSLSDAALEFGLTASASAAGSRASRTGSGSG